MISVTVLVSLALHRGKVLLLRTMLLESCIAQMVIEGHLVDCLSLETVVDLELLVVCLGLKWLLLFLHLLHL